MLLILYRQSGTFSLHCHISYQIFMWLGTKRFQLQLFNFELFAGEIFKILPLYSLLLIFYFKDNYECILCNTELMGLKYILSYYASSRHLISKIGVGSFGFKRHVWKYLTVHLFVVRWVYWTLTFFLLFLKSKLMLATKELSSCQVKNNVERNLAYLAVCRIEVDVTIFAVNLHQIMRYFQHIN